MRILHVTAYFAPAFAYGGPPRSVLGLCKALRKAGVDVEVATTTANGHETPLIATAEPVPYEGVPARYFPLQFPARIFRAPRMREFLRKETQTFDLVHVHGLWNWVAWTGVRESARAAVPYVISARGMLEPAALNHRWLGKKIVYRAVEQSNLRNASFLHATAASEQANLLKLNLNVPVVLLPNAVENLIDRNTSRGAFRRRSGIDATTPLVVWIGRIHRIKRLDLLIEAFRRVRQCCLAELVIAGPDETGLRSGLENPIGGEDAGVHWLGEIDAAAKRELLADADVLVMCSDSESFGMSVLEALSAGVPVVVTRTCPWPEVESAGCGFWVPQDAAEIAGGILRIISARECLPNMRRRAQELVREKYLWSSVARRMTEFYAEAIARAAARRESWRVQGGCQT
ncbi:MAG: glycosyltransferase [Terriglobales bacterium]